MRKTKFGIKQVPNETPKAAKWFFRIFFYMTSTITLGLTTLTRIPADKKLILMEVVTFANLAVHGSTKLFGIEDEKIDFYAKS